MLSNLLDIVNESATEPVWDDVWWAACDYGADPAANLLELCRALWLESNDPEAYDALVAGLEG